MIRLISGPPGAGKNTYIESRMKDGDFVFDFDVLRATYPHMSLDELKDLRQTIYGSLGHLDRDAWVIQCVAQGDKRTEIAQTIKADEVIVLETPAEVAKERVKTRGREPERNDDVFKAIDDWWSHYGVVSSDVIVKPDMGTPFRQEEKQMANTDTDLGFPKDTPVAEMSDKEQAAYWKHKARKHENNYKALGDVDALKDKATKWDTHEAANAPKVTDKDNGDNQPLDRDALKKELLAELKRDEAPGLVRNRFKSIIGDRLEEETVDTLLEDINVSNFIKQDGSIDVDRIKTKAELLAPAPKQVTRRQGPASHQGQRDRKTSSTVADGATLFEEFSKKK